MRADRWASPVLIDLEERTIIRVPHEFEVVVRCTGGTLWITQIGKLEDLCLPPHETFIIHRGNDSIIGATETSSLALYLADSRQRGLALTPTPRGYELRHVASGQAMKVKGKCRIRISREGSALCVQ